MFFWAGVLGMIFCGGGVLVSFAVTFTTADTLLRQSPAFVALGGSALGDQRRVKHKGLFGL